MSDRIEPRRTRRIRRKSNGMKSKQSPSSPWLIDIIIPAGKIKAGECLRRDTGVETAMGGRAFSRVPAPVREEARSPIVCVYQPVASNTAPTELLRFRVARCGWFVPGSGRLRKSPVGCRKLAGGVNHRSCKQRAAAPAGAPEPRVRELNCLERWYSDNGKIRPSSPVEDARLAPFEFGVWTLSVPSI